MGPQILVFSMNPMGLFLGGRRFLGRKSWGRGWVWRWNLWSWQSQKNAWKALRSSHCMWSHCWWTLRHSAFGGAATAATKTLGSVGSIRSWEIPELHGTLGKTWGKYGKIPEPNEGFVGKVIYNWRVFQPAMLDHQRVSHKKWEFHQQEFWLGFGIYNWASARFEVC